MSRRCTGMADVGNLFNAVPCSHKVAQGTRCVIHSVWCSRNINMNVHDHPIGRAGPWPLIPSAISDFATGCLARRGGWRSRVLHVKRPKSRYGITEHSARESAGLSDEDDCVHLARDGHHRALPAWRGRRRHLHYAGQANVVRVRRSRHRFHLHHTRAEHRRCRPSAKVIRAILAKTRQRILFRPR